jgi:hypothetical protein
MSPLDALILLGQAGEPAGVRHDLAARMQMRSDIVLQIDLTSRLVKGQRMVMEPDPKTLNDVGLVRWLDMQWPY